MNIVRKLLAGAAAVAMLLNLSQVLGFDGTTPYIAPLWGMYKSSHRFHFHIHPRENGWGISQLEDKH